MLGVLVLVLCSLTSINGFHREAVLERIEVLFQNKSYGQLEVNVRRIGRRVMAISANLTLLKELERDTMYSIMILKEDRGEYKKTAFQYFTNACKYLKTDHKRFFAGMKGLEHFINDCPIKKGKYWFNNLTVPVATLDLLPLWRMCVEGRLYRKNYEIVRTQTFIAMKEV